MSGRPWPDPACNVMGVIAYVHRHASQLVKVFIALNVRSALLCLLVAMHGWLTLSKKQRCGRPAGVMQGWVARQSVGVPAALCASHLPLGW